VVDRLKKIEPLYLKLSPTSRECRRKYDDDDDDDDVLSRSPEAG
jgi:hypothetical protein